MACGGCPSGAIESYVDVRRAKCKACDFTEWNEDKGICLPTAEKHGREKADIQHGIERPELSCPKDEWFAVETTCPRCNRPRQLLSVKHRVCSWCVIKHRLEQPEKKHQTPRSKVATGGFSSRGSSFRETGETQWVSLQQLAHDVQLLASSLPSDITAIVGVARSGITPASMVASLLHLPLLSIRQTLNDVVEVGNGWRLGGSNHIKAAASGKVAIVDDTVMTGNSLKAIAAIVRNKFPHAITAAIYVNPLAKRKPDIWVRDLGWPHLLEWNIFNSVLSPNVAVDFDGILCQDCPRGSDDDGPRYLEFIRNAKPLYVPRKVPLPLIVTARIEKYRAETEDWLKRHRINFYRLVMHPAATLRERQRDDIAAFKARHFGEWASTHIARPAPLMFIESEDWQARRISQLTGLLTVCPSTGRVYREEKTDIGNSFEAELAQSGVQKQSYAPGSLDEHLIAVTALSEQPHHRTRQTQCLDSWVRFGLSIIAVNTADEISRLREVYPQVSRWIESDEETGSYRYPTQKIKRLAKVAEEIDKPILLINSDIEIEGEQLTLIDRLADKSLVVGIRWNYDGELANASREPWGMDAFVITPEMSRTIPNLEMGIGRPTWDYWLAYHFESLGYKMDFIGDPMFFHAAHTILWDDREWFIGADRVGEHYGIDIHTDFHAEVLRRRWPFPPS
jgi:adenine/guanine phosphoribosyltransferase-like PRPP-binding protein